MKLEKAYNYFISGKYFWNTFFYENTNISLNPIIIKALKLREETVKIEIYKDGFFNIIYRFSISKLFRQL